MSYALIAAIGAAAAGLDDGVTTGDIDTGGTDLIVVSGDGFGGDAVAMSDSKSNTWLTAVAYDADSARKIRIFYAYAPTVGSGHNFTLTAPRAKSLSVTAWSGAVTSPLDQVTAGGNNGAIGATFTLGSLSPTEDDTLVIVALATEGTTDPPFSIDSGFTLATNVAGVAAAAFGSGMAYLIQTAAATSNPTATSNFGAGAYAWGVQANFKSGGGGGGAIWSDGQPQFPNQLTHPRPTHSGMIPPCYKAPDTIAQAYLRSQRDRWRGRAA